MVTVRAVPSAASLGSVDRDIRQNRVVLAADRVVKVAVQKLGALEAGGVGDTVDRLKDRVDLELIRIALLLRHACFVGGRSDEALKFDKHVRDFLKATFGDVDNLVSALRVGDRAVDGRLLCAEILRRDETCRIVGAAVDAVAGRKALQALGHALVLVAKHALGNK